MRLIRGIFPDAKRRRLWRRVACLALVGYLVAMFPLGCGKFLADRLMLYPSRGPILTFGAEPRFVEVPGGGRVQVLVARGASAIGRSPERFVLRLEGNGSRAENHATDVAARWNDVPSEVWDMNHPGFGQSDGPAALDGLAPAALAAYDALCAQAGDRPVYLDADSMGTTMALYVAAARRESRPAAGLVLKNAPPLRTLVLGRFGWWNLWLAAGPVAWAIPADLDSVANGRRVAAPAVFLRAENDSLVAPWYQRKVIAAYAGPTRVVVLAGADHNTPIDPADEAAVRAAMAELFGGAVERTRSTR